jgi:DNA polymerase III subunit delta'
MSCFGKLEFLLDDSINQSNISLLSHMVEQGRISNSYLFIGNGMEDLYSLALSFAACINCPDGGCGKCKICRDTLKGTHPDVLTVEPGGNILRVEEISNLQKFMSMSSYSSGRKICVIKEAELMNKEASNRLLKTLEDPADPGSVFILLSEELSSMLPTVVSRCLVYRWNIGSATEKKEDADFRIMGKYIDEGLREIAAENSIRSSLPDLSIRIMEILKKMEEGIKTDLEKEVAMIKKSGYASDDIERYVSVLKSRHKRKLAKFRNLGISNVFDIISGWLEDIISVKMGSDRERLNFKKNYNYININLKKVRMDGILQLMGEIEKNRMHLGYSINPELALDNIFLQVKKLRNQE